MRNHLRVCELLWSPLHHHSVLMTARQGKRHNFCHNRLGAHPFITSPGQMLAPEGGSQCYSEDEWRWNIGGRRTKTEMSHTGNFVERNFKESLRRLGSDTRWYKDAPIRGRSFLRGAYIDIGYRACVVSSSTSKILKPDSSVTCLHGETSWIIIHRNSQWNQVHCFI